MRVERQAPPGPPRPGAASRASSLFSLPPEAASAAPDPDAPEAAAPGALGALLAIDPAIDAAQAQAEAEADAQARRHGNDMLKALARLQAARLNHDDAAARDTLVALAGTRPLPADAGLAALLQAIAQRAAIELARRDG